MGLIKKCDLYPHLSSEYIQENENFSFAYDYEQIVTESDKLLHKKLNDLS